MTENQEFLSQTDQRVREQIARLHEHVTRLEEVDRLTERVERLEAVVRELQELAHRHPGLGWASGVELRGT